MASSVLGYEEGDRRVAAIWGRLIFLCCMSTAVVYALVGLFAARRLIATDGRWLFIIPLYFVIGVFHAFFTLAVLCVAVACVFFTFGGAMSNAEMITYSAAMVVVTVFFACGKKTLLYAI